MCQRLFTLVITNLTKLKETKTTGLSRMYLYIFIPHYLGISRQVASPSEEYSLIFPVNSKEFGVGCTAVCLFRDSSVGEHHLTHYIAESGSRYSV